MDLINLSDENLVYWHLLITAIGLLVGTFLYYSKKKKSHKLDSSQIADWTRKVLKRFKKKCDICGADEDIQVHHTWSKSHYPKKAYVVNLGRPLCRLHHNGEDKELKIVGIHIWMGGTKEKTTMSDYKLYKQMCKDNLTFQTKHDYLEYLKHSGVGIQEELQYGALTIISFVALYLIYKDYI